MDKPYPVGTIVDYHGSQGHGRYVITAHHRLDDLFRPGELEQMAANGIRMEDAYPDGVAYEIWREGVLRKFGNRMYSIVRVRRASLTPTGHCEEAPEV
jgi:hypothetical protein